MNVLWSILWLILLILFIWYVAGLASWLYILLLPFQACIPVLAPLNDLLLRVLQFPFQVGVNIRDGRQGCEYEWIASLAAWLYILLLPFVACIPVISPLTNFLLKVVQYPGETGKNIRYGRQGC